MIKSFLISLIIFTTILFSQTPNSHFDQLLTSEEIRTNANQDYVPISQLSSSVKIQKNSKSPWLAFILSAMLPGAGQLYNGDYVKAIIQPALFAGGAYLASSICFDCSSTDQSAAGIGLGIAVLSYLWSIIDALVSASNYNQEMLNISNQPSLKIMANNTYQLPQHYNTIVNVKINF